MNDSAIYLDSYRLQADSRIRLPKSAIENLHAIPGVTRFTIYFDKSQNALILVASEEKEDPDNEKN